MRATVIAAALLLAACGGSKSQTPVEKSAAKACALSRQSFDFFVAEGIDQGHHDGDDWFAPIRQRCGAKLDAALARLGS